jgi:hypothetical protein
VREGREGIKESDCYYSSYTSIVTFVLYIPFASFLKRWRWQALRVFRSQLGIVKGKKRLFHKHEHTQKCSLLRLLSLSLYGATRGEGESEKRQKNVRVCVYRKEDGFNIEGDLADVVCILSKWCKSACKIIKRHSVEKLIFLRSAFLPSLIISRRDTTR